MNYQDDYSRYEICQVEILGERALVLDIEYTDLTYESLYDCSELWKSKETHSLAVL